MKSKAKTQRVLPSTDSTMSIYQIPLHGSIHVMGEAGGGVLLRATPDGLEVIRTRGFERVDFLTIEPGA